MKIKDFIKQADSYSQQGAAAYGKYLFQFTAVGICDVYDLKKKNHIAQITYESSEEKHCDTVCFGWLKVDKKDEFPVIYVSGSQIWQNKDNGLIWVYRIVHKKQKWGLNLVQIIKTPKIEDTGICPDALVSATDNSIWLMGWKTDVSKPQENGSGAFLKFLKFKVPSLNDGDIDDKKIRNVVFSMENCLAEFDISNAHIVQQGICLRNQMVYIPYGDSADGYQGIDIVSLEEKRIIQNIDLMGTPVKEPEAVFFYKDDLYIADQATTIKKLESFKENE